MTSDEKTEIEYLLSGCQPNISAGELPALIEGILSSAISEFDHIDPWLKLVSEKPSAELFDYLKSQFKFVMVISHIDAMKDIMDTLIEIKKDDGYSNVKY